MDYRKSSAPSNTVTRDMMKLSADTGNVYETVMIIGKRANQISVEMKQDLEKKLQEFASYNDNLEEVFENREQIEAVVVDDRHPVAGVQELAVLHHVRPVGVHHHQQRPGLGVDEGVGPADAGQVYVMGHEYADMDAVGAAAGICCAARRRGKRAQIVIDLEGNNARPLVRRLADPRTRGP
mgnify:CR=1 FL=1